MVSISWHGSASRMFTKWNEDDKLLRLNSARTHCQSTDPDLSNVNQFTQQTTEWSNCREIQLTFKAELGAIECNADIILQRKISQRKIRSSRNSARSQLEIVNCYSWLWIIADGNRTRWLNADDGKIFVIEHSNWLNDQRLIIECFIERLAISTAQFHFRSNSFAACHCPPNNMKFVQNVSVEQQTCQMQT